MNCPFFTRGYVHAACSVLLHHRLGLRNRLHDRSAPQRTINQGSTLPELQYQQVLDTLAQFAARPASLPRHVNLREGTSQVTDSLSGGAAIDLGPPVTWFPQLLGSR